MMIINTNIRDEMAETNNSFAKEWSMKHQTTKAQFKKEFSRCVESSKIDPLEVKAV